MKILLIHSQDVEVIKNKEATSNPQEFAEDCIKMEGLVLVCYVSVEDQVFNLIFIILSIN